jgi:hypothetical protein
VLSFDECEKSAKQNLEESSTSVASFMCFISSDMVSCDSNRLQRAKNLPQGTLLVSLLPVIFLPNRKL